MRSLWFTALVSNSSLIFSFLFRGNILMMCLGILVDTLRTSIVLKLLMIMTVSRWPCSVVLEVSVVVYS